MLAVARNPYFVVIMHAHAQVTKSKGKLLATSLQFNGDLMRGNRKHPAAAGRGTVRSLVFRRCRGMGDDACALIGNALTAIQCVRHLALIDCKHLSSRGATRLFRGCKHLRSLHLANCNRIPSGNALRASLTKYCPQLVRPLSLCEL